MRIIDYKERYETLKKGEFLIGIYKERFLFGITRSYKDGRLLDYYNVFTANVIDEEYEERIFSRDCDIDESKLQVFTGRFDLFNSWVRHTVLLDLQEHLISPDEERSKNFYSIREKLAMAGGRPIRTEFDEKETFLLGAVSSDEDYYYVSIDGDYNIEFDTCVGKFGDVLDETPEQLKKFLPENVTKNTSNKVYEALVKRMWREPDVFFTPIYFDFKDDNKTEILKSMEMLLPEKEEI